jgi:hypothetical protein
MCKIGKIVFGRIGSRREIFKMKNSALSSNSVPPTSIPWGNKAAKLKQKFQLREKTDAVRVNTRYAEAN